MKKLFLTVVTIILALALTACGGLDTGLHRTWLSDDAPYVIETFVFDVAMEEGLSTDSGTYTMRATRIPSTYDGYDSLIDVNVAHGGETPTYAPISGDDKAALISKLRGKGGYVLTTELEFGNNADGFDRLYTELILDTNYMPLATFKMLDVASERSADTTATVFSSYFYSASYTYNASSALTRYDSTVCRKSSYNTYTAQDMDVTENLSGNVWDASQIIYVMRSLNYAQDSFGYTYREPAPLDNTVGGALSTTPLKDMSISVARETSDVTVPVNGRAPTSCNVIMMSLTNVPISGSPIYLYFTVNPIDVEYAGASRSVNKVPMQIVQGDYTYKLKQIVLG